MRLRERERRGGRGVPIQWLDCEWGPVTIGGWVPPLAEGRSRRCRTWRGRYRELLLRRWLTADLLLVPGGHRPGRSMGTAGGRWYPVMPTAMESAGSASGLRKIIL